MTNTLEQWRSVGVGAVISLALVSSVLGLQYFRHGWPFAQSQSASTTTEDGPQQTMPGMPGMSGTPPSSHGSHGSHADAGTLAGGLPPGYSPITIDPAHAGALLLATATVEERDFTKTLRTVGIVTVDETRSAHVHSKVRGWIDGIYVNFIGRRIKTGEPLCSIYSQEVYSAEIEFLSILDRAAGRPSASGVPARPDPLLDAARRRLALWDVPRAEIARLESTREARRTFPLLAPRAGVVVSKEAIEGMYVDPSVELYTLSDFSRVWVLADVYESDVPYVHVGAHARLTIEGQTPALDATVSFVSPTIDEATRTLKVRFQLDNRGGRLRPGGFVSVEMDLAIGQGLSIPESAVVRTGARAIVFVAHGERSEHLQPREVTLGPMVGDNYRVDAGLAAGERVAVGAQFLLDSESRLRATSAPGGGHVH